jgi:hypothetical protein
MLPDMPKLRLAYVMHGMKMHFSKQSGMPQPKPPARKYPPLPRFKKAAQPV